MKPISARVIESIGSNLFTVKAINLPYFSTEFHFHEECQLVYVVESEGKRIVGDSVEHFESEELIFLGSDVPHVWHNDNHYFDDDKNVHARSIALFFNPVTLLEQLSGVGHTKKLQTMLAASRRGMKFYGETKIKLTQLLLQMLEQKGLPQMISLLQILEIMSHTKEFDFLASNGYINHYQSRDNDRMDRVFKYVFNNFKEEIALSAIAAVANMNKQAFCRHFKTCTQKTFVQFVNEIRIGHACKLLSNPDEAITSIVFECGFNSVSNFNRFFKEIKGMTPREYRKLFE